MDDGKVDVSISEIENGYLVRRSWCEKTKNKDGEDRYNYHSETYYMASLPPLLKKMFSKGKNKTDFGGKDKEDKDGFDAAIEEMDAEASDADSEEEGGEDDGE